MCCVSDKNFTCHTQDVSLSATQTVNPCALANIQPALTCISPNQQQNSVSSNIFRLWKYLPIQLRPAIPPVSIQSVNNIASSLYSQYVWHIYTRIGKIVSQFQKVASINLLQVQSPTICTEPPPPTFYGLQQHPTSNGLGWGG